ncbi:hypothetical protein B0T17DRAFT_642683 [Bombardia bombarda]|uniref:Uncharacterized protein n=1 Tax=Bombardia bombarda TaxID=252184 RepID=A0AA39WLW0_9PEZI|nr:hypothetical protein B0T17DRAFT_642683 [Bombardia bombarda]
MRLREASSRRRPGRYSEDDDHNMHVEADRPAFTHEDAALNQTLAVHCAFPSLDMRHPGPGPSEVWRKRAKKEAAAKAFSVRIIQEGETDHDANEEDSEDVDDEEETSEDEEDDSDTDDDYEEEGPRPDEKQRLILSVTDMHKRRRMATTPATKNWPKEEEATPQSTTESQARLDQDRDTVMGDNAAATSSNDSSGRPSPHPPHLAAMIVRRPKSPDATQNSTHRASIAFLSRRRVSGRSASLFSPGEESLARGSAEFTPPSSAASASDDRSFKLRSLSRSHPNWPELSDGVKYLIIYELTQSGLSFTRAVNQLDLVFEEVALLIELIRLEKAKVQKYNEDFARNFDNQAADEVENEAAAVDGVDGGPTSDSKVTFNIVGSVATPSAPLVTNTLSRRQSAPNANHVVISRIDKFVATPRTLLVTDVISEKEVRRGKAFLSFLGLNDIAIRLGYYVGTAEEDVYYDIPINHLEADGFKHLLPHFNNAHLEELQDMLQAERQRAFLQPQTMTQGELLVRMDAPPETINPRRLDHRVNPTKCENMVPAEELAKGLHWVNYKLVTVDGEELVHKDTMNNHADAPGRGNEEVEMRDRPPSVAPEPMEIDNRPSVGENGPVLAEIATLDTQQSAAENEEKETSSTNTGSHNQGASELLIHRQDQEQAKENTSPTPEPSEVLPDGLTTPIREHLRAMKQPTIRPLSPSVAEAASRYLKMHKEDIQQYDRSNKKKTIPSIFDIYADSISTDQDEDYDSRLVQPTPPPSAQKKRTKKHVGFDDDYDETDSSYNEADTHKKKKTTVPASPGRASVRRTPHNKKLTQPNVAAQEPSHSDMSPSMSRKKSSGESGATAMTKKSAEEVHAAQPTKKTPLKELSLKKTAASDSGSMTSMRKSKGPSEDSSITVKSSTIHVENAVSKRASVKKTIAVNSSIAAVDSSQSTPGNKTADPAPERLTTSQDV